MMPSRKSGVRAGAVQSGGAGALLTVFVVAHAARVLTFYSLDSVMQTANWLPTACFTCFILTIAGAALLLVHQPCSGWSGLKRENYASIAANGAALAVSLQCWVCGLRNIGAPGAAIFESGGVCVATILPACLRPIRTERARSRVMSALIMLVGYIIVIISPAGHGAALEVPPPPSVHQTVHDIVYRAPKEDVRAAPRRVEDGGLVEDRGVRRRILGFDAGTPTVAIPAAAAAVVRAGEDSILRSWTPTPADGEHGAPTAAPTSMWQRSPFFGLACILLSLLIEHGRSKSSKTLEKRAGGRHQLMAITTLVAAFICVPIVIFGLATVDWATEADLQLMRAAPTGKDSAARNATTGAIPDFNQASTNFVYAVGAFVAVGFLFPYYVDRHVKPRVGVRHSTDGLVVATATVTVFVYSYLSGGSSHHNIMLLLGAAAACVGSDQLTKAIVATSSSTRPFGAQVSHYAPRRGGGEEMLSSALHFLGLGPSHSDRGGAVSPLSRLDKKRMPGDKTRRQSGGGLLNHIFNDRESIRIFVFVCLNVAFMFVEIMVGWYSNSLGLISDAGHMLFDNFALFLGLYAAFMSRWAADSDNSYGYGRYEILCAFGNAIFLVFIAFTILFESIDRFGEPPKVYGKHLLWTSVVGFIVNAIGIGLFHDHGAVLTGSSHSHCHGHSHGHGAPQNHNVRAIFLHIVADALGSMGVIISSLLVKYYQLYLADPICSAIISLLIIASVIPLLQDAGYILIQGTDAVVLQKSYRILHEFKSLDGVLAASNMRIWTLNKDKQVGTVSLEMSSDPLINHQTVLTQARQVWSSFGVKYGTTQISRRGEGE